MKPESTPHPATDHDAAFASLRRQYIESLDVTVEEYRHIKTGAMHYHIASDNPENVFLVAFRTVPEDSSGVAHILEHTVLCGSEHYPVRDPFFMMIRRSLNTFMNAMTSSDWTAYPFASENRKDFYNLMDVYLDSVFFPRLDELDFAQEGHRIEFSEAENPDSDLVYKGVVFNEMKGAMSSPVSTLWQYLTSHLFPTTTYHYNSGGDPERIPDLTHRQLLEFFRSHYHPSNAVFMTFGDIPAADHQQRFEDRALKRFDRLDCIIDVHDEKRFSAPQRTQERYAIDATEETAGKTHIVVGWLLGRSIDQEAMLRAHLLSGVLLDNSASPLRQALESSSLGTAPSPLCGLEDSNREMSFVCGIEGSEPERVADVEKLVMDVLQSVADNGIPQERVEAVLHQLELSQREISGDGYPYGLHLIISGLSAAIHRGDVIAALHPDPILEQLRQDISDPDFIKNLVRRELLDNPHRVTLVMQPDQTLSAQRSRAEAERLAAIKAKLDDEEKRRIVERATLLAQRQMQQDDPELLPKVELSDIPPQARVIEGQQLRLAGYDTTVYEQGTNGLSYQQIVIRLPAIPESLQTMVPLYTSTLTELGCNGLDYAETQSWQDKVSGGIHAYTTLRGDINDEQRVSGYFVLSSKGLIRNNAEVSELMQQTLQSIRFDELGHLREIIAQLRARRVQSVTGHGHSLAMLAASSGMSPVSAWQHRLQGLAGIRNLKRLDDELDDPDKLQALANQLGQLHELIQSGQQQFVVIGEHDKRHQLEQELAACWQQTPPLTGDFTALTLPPVREARHEGWTTNTEVNFCAKAYPTVTVEHADAPALDVLAGFLRNGYLHRAIREMGGAYGGGASHDSDNAVFRFYSYRDPRLAETLNDFDRAIDWLLDGSHEWRQVEEAILGVIGAMDKPGSPAGEAKTAFHNALFGRTPAQRQHYRERLLGVTLADLQRVGNTYLTAAAASVAVISNNTNLSRHPDLGLDTIAL